jgi:hypothetical protein
MNCTDKTIHKQYYETSLLFFWDKILRGIICRYQQITNIMRITLKHYVDVQATAAKAEHTCTAALAVSCSQDSKAFTLSFVASSCVVHNWYKSSTTESTTADVDELD